MARPIDTGRSEKRKAAKRRKTTSKAWLYSLILGSFILVAGIMFFVQREGGSEPWGIPAIPRNTRPSTLSPALFAGKVKEAYRIAKEVPELVERMPCYCGCYVGNGHRNNLDCYVDRHAVG